jgi:Fe2+ transport system protein FeoA
MSRRKSSTVKTGEAEVSRFRLGFPTRPKQAKAIVRREIAGGDPFALAHATEGQRLRIAAHAVGKELSRRLRDLGLPLGCEIRALHHMGGGAMVVALDTMRVALGPDITERVLVTVIDAPGTRP